MIKKNLRFSLLITIFALPAIILSSCASVYFAFVPYRNYIADSDSHQLVEGNGYFKPGDYEAYTYLNGDGEEESFADFTDVYRHKDYRRSMRSLGRQKMLVIPVDFADYPSSMLPEGTDGSLEVLRNAFFGINKNNHWRSVAGFYNESSYGKLILDGKVTDWYRSSKLAATIRNSSSKSQTVRDIYNGALSWYQEKYGDLASYYTDGDTSKSVPVYLVYSHPSETGSDARDKMFWAFTINQKPTLTCWSSYSLTYLTEGRPDTHTYIHEVGHLLGLDDYYNTDGEIYGPTGRADMMDYSIGDHTGYSKMLLDWTRPYVVTGTTEITIRPFYNSGDLILIKDNWNGTAMDEYLMLEFYSPNGLNGHDSRMANYDPQLMQNAGLKVYHVDSRLAYFTNDGFSRTLGYVGDGAYSQTTHRVGIAHTNTQSTTYNGHRLYHLLESNGENSFISGGVATNKTLFSRGDSFGLDTFANFTFNGGEALGYTFTITALTNTYANLSIIKI
jgi:M6 family metalloprotease-like protein